MTGIQWKSNIFLLTLLGAMILLVAAKPAPDKYELINSLPIAGKSISTDQLRNVYVVTQNNLVERYDSSGTLTGRFSENRYGNLNIVDASSPFNLLYFYADTKTVLTGDVKMNVKNLFKLSTIGINLPRAACLSYDNYIWVFDGSDNKLKKVNNNYEITYTSEDITMFVGQSINPNFIVERDGFIFLNDPGLGILVFDRYGTYYNAFPIPGLSSFQVIKNMVLYQDGNSLRIYNYSTRETKSIPLPTTEPIKSIRLERGRLFILTETELKIYSESE